MSDCKMNLSDSNHTHHSCKVTSTNSSLYQTLDELDFERGIWYAAQTNDLQRVKKLVDEGTNVNIVDRAGYTALHYAARNGCLEVCKYLLQNRADINTTTRAGGATALQRACSAGQVDIVHLLLGYKADCKIKDNDGKTALHRAAESQKKELCEMIISECPLLKNELDNKNKTPGDYAKTEDLAIFLR